MKTLLNEFQKSRHLLTMLIIQCYKIESVYYLIRQHTMQDDKIKIRLPNAREKLQTLFPTDTRGDITIEFSERQFKLQKAFLRL